MIARRGNLLYQARVVTFHASTSAERFVLRLLPDEQEIATSRHGFLRRKGIVRALLAKRFVF